MYISYTCIHSCIFIYIYISIYITHVLQMRHMNVIEILYDDVLLFVCRLPAVDGSPVAGCCWDVFAGSILHHSYMIHLARTHTQRLSLSLSV